MLYAFDLIPSIVDWWTVYFPIPGAKVIVACRDVKKAEQAVSDIVADVKGDNVGQLVVEELDLASFASIKRCAKNILQKENKIHLLVNNAGKFVCTYL